MQTARIFSCVDPVFTGIEVPNWTTDSPLFNVGTDDYPVLFESIESSTVLESILRDVQEEHHFTNRDMENEELLRKEKITVNKQHAKRMAQISKDWEDNLNIAMKAWIESYATVPSTCWICKKGINSNYIHCTTCVKVYCSQCDIAFHTSTTLHNRDLMQSTNVVKLKAKEFWDMTEYVVVVKDVPVPCFVPLECNSCHLKNSLNLEPSKEVSMIVCTSEGRFDLNGASFRCLNTSCEYHKEPVLASMPDYVISGLWPGSPTRSCTLFTKSVLVKWFHLKHKTPSTAAMKYLEVLEKMATESGRVLLPSWHIVGWVVTITLFGQLVATILYAADCQYLVTTFSLPQIPKKVP
ncbi:hypothetical protein OUZ56_018427 [Daphnia magna]|uniref:CxC3 like cysteine cluster domain-containing protein n=1 Tax=Daphnia magna TaxID=35525 RepID=A0ABQ9Z9X6_9CRUS|nr:hypothetical protein OUZ56_018427 [Daphnia magna]